MATIELPEPELKGDVSVEEAIHRRRSRRRFADRPLTTAQFGQLLWCAQGITGPAGRKRAAPSAGATYPMTLYAAIGDGTVEGMEAGVYRYVPEQHAVELRSRQDARSQIAAAALGQRFLAEAPLNILMAARYERTTGRYGERGIRYVAMEAGHIGENIYLQAEALGLATVAVGAFGDEAVAEAFGLPAELDALYLMPVGHPR
ncbi:MAG: SagB/ThcOx family dehydrogenase [Candidatus Brocadiaceae bacterium]